MRYKEAFALKDGRVCVVRNAEISDAPEVIRNYYATHKETDFLASYAEEKTITVEEEESIIEAQNKSDHAVLLCAYVDNQLVGTAGLGQIRNNVKMGHRATFGIGVEQEYWGLGIGTAMIDSVIKCARESGYLQLELEVVADNVSAMHLYEKMGFVEMGRNPRGFRTKSGIFQELVSMRLEL